VFEFTILYLNVSVYFAYESFFSLLKRIIFLCERVICHCLVSIKQKHLYISECIIITMVLENIVRKTRNGLLGLALVSTLGFASQPDNYTVSVDATRDDAPISDATGFVHANGDTLDLVFDEFGSAYHSADLSPVGDVPRAAYSINAFPNPGVGTVNVGVPADKDLSDVAVNFYDLLGHHLDNSDMVSAGVYFARVTADGVPVATKKITFDGRTRVGDVDVNFVPGDYSSKRSLDKSVLEPMDAELVVSSLGDTLREGITLFPDVINEYDVDFEGGSGDGVRLYGSVWNQRIRDQVGGSLAVRTSDGVVHSASIDTLASDSFDFTISGYDVSEPVDVWVDNGDYSNQSTSLFPRGEIAATRNIANELGAPAVTTLGDLAVPEGVFVYTVADSVFNHPFYQDGLTANTQGLVKNYPHEEMHFISYKINPSTGEEISENNADEQSYCMGYLSDRMLANNGHVMVNSDTTSSLTLPEDPIRTVILYRFEGQQSSTQQPANQNHFDRAMARVRNSDPVGYMMREATEAVRVWDEEGSGSNTYAIGGTTNAPVFSSLGADVFYSNCLFEGEWFESK